MYVYYGSIVNNRPKKLTKKQKQKNYYGYPVLLHQTSSKAAQGCVCGGGRGEGEGEGVRGIRGAEDGISGEVTKVLTSFFGSNNQVLQIFH